MKLLPPLLSVKLEGWDFKAFHSVNNVELAQLHLFANTKPSFALMMLR